MSDPEARLAAAHAKLLGHDGQCSSPFGRCPSWDAIHEMVRADPTLICPDPAAHEGVTFTADSLARRPSVSQPTTEQGRVLLRPTQAAM